MAQVAQSSTSSDTSGTKSKIGTIGTTATFTGTTDRGRAISIALSHPKPKCLLGAPGGPRLLSFADGAHGGAAFFFIRQPLMASIPHAFSIGRQPPVESHVRYLHE